MKKIRLVIVILAVLCVAGLFLYAALSDDGIGGKAPETTTVAETTTLVEMPDALTDADNAATTVAASTEAAA